MSTDIPSDESMLEKMFRAAAGKNAINYISQLQKRKLQYQPHNENLGWVNSDEPNTLTLNSIYKESNEGKRNIAPRALSTALHEMFHSQDFMNGRKIGQLGMPDEAVYLMGSEMAKDTAGKWNPGYSPYSESLTRLRTDDMFLPQGESILNDPVVQKYIDKAWERSKYNSSFTDEANKPKAKKAFIKALEYGLYPEQRWLEPREPTIKESVSDWIDKILGKKEKGP